LSRRLVAFHLIVCVLAVLLVGGPAGAAARASVVEGGPVPVATGGADASRGGPALAGPERAAVEGTAVSDSAAGIGTILDRYNAGVRRVLEGIESLRVAQTMYEIEEDGITKRACAVLTYERGAGMVRDETFSEITYPVGVYTLSSLVGPLLDPSEYDIEYGGVEEEAGRACHRLEVTARVRDRGHFDGSIWISCEGAAPVRIIGAVADPPFPATEIGLDKLFSPGPAGVWLVRKHVGRGEFKFLFVSKRGERRLFYDDYEIRFSGPAAGAAGE